MLQRLGPLPTSLSTDRDDLLSRTTVIKQMSTLQQSLMIALVGKHGLDKDVVCAVYAEAELDGMVARPSEHGALSPIAFAHLLWHEGEVGGWLQTKSLE